MVRGVGGTPLTRGSLRRRFDQPLRLGFFFFAGVGALLQHLARRVDVDRAPAARLFAEPAAGAALLVEHGDAEEVADDALRLAQVQRVERADLDAQLAAAADAVVLDDDRLRPLFARERPADVADAVQDRLRRADDAARTAVDAQ